MKIKPMFVRILACAIFVATGTASAAPICATVRDPHTETGVLHAEDMWVRALETKNVNGLSCLLAPGFADAAWDGNVWTREQVIDALPQRKPHAIHLSNVKAHVEGDTAVVRGRNTLLGPDGTTIAAVDFTDIFKYRNGRWQAVTAQEVLRR